MTTRKIKITNIFFSKKVRKKYANVCEIKLQIYRMGIPDSVLGGVFCIMRVNNSYVDDDYE